MVQYCFYCLTLERLRCKFTPMTAQRQTTLKTSPEALRLLRIVAAMTNEKQYEVLERLLKAELNRLGVASATKQTQKKRTLAGS